MAKTYLAICRNFPYWGSGEETINRSSGCGLYGCVTLFEGGCENTQSAKKWLNFNLGGGGVGCQTENTQSAKKWLNFNFRGGGGGFCSESGALSEF